MLSLTCLPRITLSLTCVRWGILDSTSAAKLSTNLSTMVLRVVALGGVAGAAADATHSSQAAAGPESAISGKSDFQSLHPRVTGQAPRSCLYPHFELLGRQVSRQVRLRSDDVIKLHCASSTRVRRLSEVIKDCAAASVTPGANACIEGPDEVPRCNLPCGKSSDIRDTGLRQ